MPFTYKPTDMTKVTNEMPEMFTLQKYIIPNKSRSIKATIKVMKKHVVLSVKMNMTAKTRTSVTARFDMM